MKLRSLLALPVVVGFAWLALPTVSAQETLGNLSIGPADVAAAAAATDFSFELTAPAGIQGSWADGHPADSGDDSVGPGGFYPGDLSNPLNHVTVHSAQSHDIFVNCTAACFGNPAAFLTNLGKSGFIHVVDQYIGVFQDDRYTVGPGANLPVGSQPHDFPVALLIAIIHASGVVFGGGYNNIHHIFLPPGQDLCLGPGGNTAPCYSPDNFKTFVFCAFHGSINFITPPLHVLFTVEPYQNVPGCQVHQPSPNGPLVDSTADILSHEVFETITDPDGTAWFNRKSLPLLGAEIGDECQDFNFSYGTVALHGTKYEIQPEYSNQSHGCTFNADDDE